MAYLASLQGGILRNLAAELRAGGAGTAGLAFLLGALHALTPGHGKAVLAAYFLGQDARIRKGLGVTLSAALLHVVSGLAVFLVLRALLGQLPSMLGRNPPTFTAIGYGLIVLAGVVMLAQSLRSATGAHTHGDAVALTAGIGLLPCPLTISVLGFAWAQSSAAMVGLVLMSLALGISLTIGCVALVAILARGALGTALIHRLPQIERSARILQGAAAVSIIALGSYTIAALAR